MAIYSTTFAVYERLASAKMEAFRAAINSHTHDGTYGVKISFSSLDGVISVAQIAAKSITGGVAGAASLIADSTINNQNIAPGTITFSSLDTSTVHLSDGYAVYAP